jgi:acetyl-CoA C-acetyltransferase
MPRRVAIVAAGQTDHVSRRTDVNVAEMAREAVDRCLEPAGLSPADIDAVVLGNMEMFEGINMPDQWMASTLGAAGKPLFKLNTGGTVGASTAVAAAQMLAAGTFRRILCVGYEKHSEGSVQSAITTVGDPLWERAVMAGAIGNFASMASVYVDESGVTEEHAAKVAVKARRNACRNPHAHLKMPDITVEDVLGSEMLAYPVRKLDMCPSSDGACAVLMASEEDAPGLAARPAWVHAAVTAHDQQFMGDSLKRLAEMRSLIAASRKAYAQAGVSDPVAELDVAEVYEPATYAELAMYECLGFCAKGDGGRMIDEGVTEMDGALPVNPSGGVLSANPVGATALVRVAEAALQTMGAAGERQVDGVERALATGYGGNAWTELMILGTERP